ncbi:transcriptional regulator FtrA [Thalassotalea euphylliae]|uniref:Transcriptional regulator FtrA n=1 Tax=Thalassotalea euphylliae TaxID=1655234 RepID=A0A3E0TMW7_9GAMM|nr:transcriptional regulator FtrA [Thalassotalea euphylliae]REL25482.1 transcriptional regulator FtrA [Thalassotalea euphylliae]
MSDELSNHQSHLLGNQQKRVAALVYDGLCVFEFGCVAEVFGLARPELGEQWLTKGYRFDTLSIDGTAVITQYHAQIQPTLAATELTQLDTLIIPGWCGVDQPVPNALIAMIQQAHQAGVRLVSICSGVFVLAAAGVLNGKTATTHWRYASQLQQQYPDIQVNTDVLYVDNGSVLTSAGSAAGLDLCLHLVRKDYGQQVVNTIARRLVIPPIREGSQAQFIEQPIPCNERNRMTPLLTYLQATISKPHSNAELAKFMHMSERSLLRHFKAATGTTPAEWLIEQRLQCAKSLLEQSSLPLELVAEQSGLGTAMTLRHHFRHRLNISPTAYRRHFSNQLNKTMTEQK